MVYLSTWSDIPHGKINKKYLNLIITWRVELFVGASEKYNWHQKNTRTTIMAVYDGVFCYWLFSIINIYLSQGTPSIINFLHYPLISGSSYLFITYVTSWLDTVLLESVWGFNGMFTDYRGTLLLSKQLGPSLCRPEGAQEWPSVTRAWRVGSQSLATSCSRESSSL